MPPDWRKPRAFIAPHETPRGDQFVQSGLTICNVRIISPAQYIPVQYGPVRPASDLSDQFYLGSI